MDLVLTNNTQTRIKLVKKQPLSSQVRVLVHWCPLVDSMAGCSPQHEHTSHCADIADTSATTAAAVAVSALSGKCAHAAFEKTGPCCMILMKGHPGSGKSTLARCLAKTMHCPLVDKDDARDAMHAMWTPSAQHDRPLPPAASPGLDTAPGQMNQLAYDIMFAVAFTQLRMGLHVVVDCPLAYAHLYRRATGVAEKCGARVAVVECLCGNDAVWRERLEGRAAADAGSPSIHKPSSWAQLQDMLERYEGCWTWSTDGSVPVACLVSVDTSMSGVSPMDTSHEVLQQLEQQLGLLLM